MKELVRLFGAWDAYIASLGQYDGTQPAEASAFAREWMSKERRAALAGHLAQRFWCHMAPGLVAGPKGPLP